MVIVLLCAADSSAASHICSALRPSFPVIIGWESFMNEFMRLSNSAYSGSLYGRKGVVALSVFSIVICCVVYSTLMIPSVPVIVRVLTLLGVSQLVSMNAVRLSV